MPNVRLLPIAASCALLALSLAACNPFGGNKAAAAHTDSDGYLIRRHRPNPRHAYRIVMTIADAPGPFASVRGMAQYEVTNSDQCGRRNKFEGVTPGIDADEAFDLARVSANRYEGIVYTDLMLDEDYFGRGVCHWKFTWVRALLQATGGEADTLFVPSIQSQAIHAGTSATRYFWNREYSRTKDFDGYSDSGASGPGDYKAEIRDELFTITMEAKEAQP